MTHLPATQPHPIAHVMSEQHVTIGGVRIFDGASSAAIELCLDAIRSKVGARIATANLDFLALARDDAQLNDDLDQSHLVVADGAPVVAAARLAGARRVQRTTGVDLTASLCASGGQTAPLRVVIYGSDPQTADRAARTLEASAPGVQVALIINPPFRAASPEEDTADRAAIAAAAPHVVLVALGCPKQERRISEYFDAAPEALWIGIGGALDFFAGTRRRAAPWVRRLGIEWVTRMIQDPRRLGARYLVRDLPLLPHLVIEALLVRYRAMSAHT